MINVLIFSLMIIIMLFTAITFIYSLEYYITKKYILVSSSILTFLIISLISLTIVILPLEWKNDYDKSMETKKIIDLKIERLNEDGDWVLNGEIGSLQDVYNQALTYNKYILDRIYARKIPIFGFLNNDLYSYDDLIDLTSIGKGKGELE